MANKSPEEALVTTDALDTDAEDALEALAKIAKLEHERDALEAEGAALAAEREALRAESEAMRAEMRESIADLLCLWFADRLHRSSEAPEVLRMRRLWTVLHAESDRGFMLTLASHLEGLLAEVLQARTLGNREQKRRLLFEPGSPLGSFSAREMAAAAFGLISGSMQRDIQRIRRLRNHFAHNWTATSIEEELNRDGKLRVLVEAIEHDPIAEARPARRRLLRASMIIVGLIDHSLGMAAPSQPEDFGIDRQAFAEMVREAEQVAIKAIEVQAGDAIAAARKTVDDGLVDK